MSHNILRLLVSNHGYEYTIDYMVDYLLARAGYNANFSINFLLWLATEGIETIPLERRGYQTLTTLRIILLENFCIKIVQKNLKYKIHINDTLTGINLVYFSKNHNKIFKRRQLSSYK